MSPDNNCSDRAVDALSDRDLAARIIGHDSEHTGLFVEMVEYVRTALQASKPRNDGLSTFSHSFFVAEMASLLLAGRVSSKSVLRIAGAGLFHEVLEATPNSPLVEYKVKIKNGDRLTPADISMYWQDIGDMVSDIEKSFPGLNVGYASAILTEPPIFLEKVSKMRQCAVMADAIWAIQPSLLFAEYGDRLTDLFHNAGAFVKAEKSQNQEAALDDLATRLGEVAARTSYMLNDWKFIIPELKDPTILLLTGLYDWYRANTIPQLYDDARCLLDNRFSILSVSEGKAEDWYRAYLFGRSDEVLRFPYREAPLIGGERDIDYENLIGYWETIYSRCS